jgi:predicted kinase
MVKVMSDEPQRRLVTTDASSAAAPARFLVLVTGYAAAGKSTLAPLLAAELGALWISRDSIHEMVYSGWEPQHPALTSEQYDPQVGDSTFFEGSVVWRIFLWMLARVTTHAPVVADTPFNHDWNRTMFAEAAPEIRVPMVEVALHGDPDVLLERARARARSGRVHEIKARFSVRPERYSSGPYQPVLEDERVLYVDTTDLGAVHVHDMAHMVRSKLSAPQ